MQPRGLDLGVRDGGLKQGRPRWKLWEVTHATRHLVLPNQQKSGGLFSGEGKTRALTGGAGPSWRKSSECLFSTESTDTSSSRLFLHLSCHNKNGQTHPSGRLEDSFLEKVKQFKKHIKVWTLGKGPQQRVHPNYLTHFNSDKTQVCAQ